MATKLHIVTGSDNQTYHVREKKWWFGTSAFLIAGQGTYPIIGFANSPAIVGRKVNLRLNMKEFTAGKYIIAGRRGVCEVQPVRIKAIRFQK